MLVRNPEGGGPERTSEGEFVLRPTDENNPHSAPSGPPSGLTRSGWSCALKKVVADTDQNWRKCGDEVRMLRALGQCDFVVTLWDAELDETRKVALMILELAVMDFAAYLQKRFSRGRSAKGMALPGVIPAVEMMVEDAARPPPCLDAGQNRWLEAPPAVEGGSPAPAATEDQEAFPRCKSSVEQQRCKSSGAERRSESGAAARQLSGAGCGLPDADEIFYFWSQMLSAIAAAHEQDIMHCDLKPNNFVLVPKVKCYREEVGVGGSGGGGGILSYRGGLCWGCVFFGLVEGGRDFS